MRRWRAGVSSSATITQRCSGALSGMGIVSSPSQGQRYFDLSPSGRPRLNDETAFAAGMKSSHTLPRNRKAQATAVVERPARGKSDAIVQHAKVETIAVLLRGDDDGSTRCSPGDAV